jgi:hypothetical protein
MAPLSHLTSRRIEQRDIEDIDLNAPRSSSADSDMSIIASSDSSDFEHVRFADQTDDDNGREAYLRRLGYSHAPSDTPRMSEPLRHDPDDCIYRNGNYPSSSSVSIVSGCETDSEYSSSEYEREQEKQEIAALDDKSKSKLISTLLKTAREQQEHIQELNDDVAEGKRRHARLMDLQEQKVLRLVSRNNENWQKSVKSISRWWKDKFEILEVRSKSVLEGAKELCEESNLWEAEKKAMEARHKNEVEGLQVRILEMQDKWADEKKALDAKFSKVREADELTLIEGVDVFDEEEDTSTQTIESMLRRPSGAELEAMLPRIPAPLRNEPKPNKEQDILRLEPCFLTKVKLELAMVRKERNDAHAELEKAQMHRDALLDVITQVKDCNKSQTHELEEEIAALREQAEWTETQSLIFQKKFKDCLDIRKEHRQQMEEQHLKCRSHIKLQWETIRDAVNHISYWDGMEVVDSETRFRGLENRVQDLKNWIAQKCYEECVARKTVDRTPAMLKRTPEPYALPNTREQQRLMALDRPRPVLNNIANAIAKDIPVSSDSFY